MNRSNQQAVRNPVTALASFQSFKLLPPEAKAALRDMLKELAADAKQRADKCWRTHKAPMAAYWKAVSVYTGHIRRAIPSDGAAQSNPLDLIHSPVSKPVGPPCHDQNNRPIWDSEEQRRQWEYRI